MKFGDLGEIFDGPHATPKRVTEGPYFLNISSLKQGRLDLSQSDHISPEQFTQWTKRVTPKGGDLLFSYETRLGEAALMPEGISACLGRRMALLRPNREVVEPKFLLYWYLGPQMQKLIEKHLVMGATVPRILLSDMPTWPVNLPPLAEQLAIAEVLGALDDKIAANRKLATLAADLAQALFAGCRAESSRMTPMAEVVSTQYGLTASASDSGETRLVRVTDMNKKPWIEWETVPYASTVSSKNQQKYRLDEGDVLIARMADPGKVAYIEADDPDSYFASYLIRVRPIGEATPLYIFHFMRSPEYQAFAIANSSGSVQKNINAKRIVETLIPLPAQQAMRAFESRARALHSQMAHAVRESRTLAQLRDTLLPALMDGRLRVRDAIEQIDSIL